MAGLQQLTPILDSQAKQQAAQIQQQFQHQLQIAQLQERYDSLRQRAEDNRLNREEREQAHADSMQIRREMLAMHRELLNARMQGDPNAALSGEDLKFMADQYLAGDRTVLQNLGRGAQGSKNLVALRNAVRKEAQARGMSGADLAASVAEFEGIKAGERALGSRTAVVGMAGEAASGFAKNAVEASDKVDRTQYPDLNRILEIGRKKSGDPDIVAFAQYNNSLINAYARAVSPTGVPTVSDKDHARETLATAFSKGQYEAGVNAILKEIETEKSAPGKVRKEFRDAVTRDKPTLPEGWSVREH